MKKGIIFYLLLVFIYSCSNYSNEDLIGTWLANNIETSYKIPDDPQQKEALLNSLNEIKNSLMFQFNQDSTFTKSLKGEKEYGKWRVDGSKLFLKSGTNNIEEEISINDLDDKKLILKVNNTDGTKMIFTFNREQQ